MENVNFGLFNLFCPEGNDLRDVDFVVVKLKDVAIAITDLLAHPLRDQRFSISGFFRFYYSQLQILVAFGFEVRQEILLNVSFSRNRHQLDAIFVKSGHNVRMLIPFFACHKDKTVVASSGRSVLEQLLDIHSVVKVHPLSVQDDENFARLGSII